MNEADDRADRTTNRERQMSNPEPFIGCLLGTAVGDALGLPYEGLRPERAKKLFPDTSQHHFFFGKGMVSDDTEHACFVAQAIIRCRADVNVFRRQLARSLRWWFITLPAGIGFATLRSIIKLWFGISPEKSGVFSAGNGPAMRAPILGVAFGHDPDRLKAFVKASTAITHSDPKAFYAALAVAQAAATPAIEADDWQTDFRESLESLINEAEAAELHELNTKARISEKKGEQLAEFTKQIGSRNGISGYCYHTVPCVFQAWFRHGDNLGKGLKEIIEAGGDTDTAGAIYGGIVGARAGKQAIPDGWIGNIIEWPRSITWIEKLGGSVADALAERSSTAGCPPYFGPGILIRNLLFLLIVLAHGLRRLAPPY
jgi:ADP-ribosyl-[dinitrogen reductase] hydrolase